MEHGYLFLECHSSALPKFYSMRDSTLHSLYFSTYNNYFDGVYTLKLNYTDIHAGHYECAAMSKKLDPYFAKIMIQVGSKFNLI